MKLHLRPALGAALAITLLSASACATSSDGEDARPSQTVSPKAGDGASGDAQSAEAQKSGPSFVDGVLTTDELKIEITRHVVIAPGAKGNQFGDKPVIVFYYSTTNLSGGSVTPLDWAFNITAYQDNDPNAVNELDGAILLDDVYNQYSDAKMESIKQGGTVESYTGYELDDLTTPVDLVASDGVVGDEIGKISYALK